MGRRMFGSIRLLPSGRYQARYPGPDGRLRTAPDTFETKVDAAQFLSSVETDMLRGQWNDPRSGGVSLRAYADAWLADRRVKGRPLAPRTRDTYRHSLNAWILPTLGDLQLSKITPAVVRKWHAEVSVATGETATRQAYALLLAILNTAVADDVILRNPCRIRGAGQPHSPERPLADLETVAKLVAAMPAHLRTLVVVAFWAHARLGELLGLQRGDVDLSAGTLRIERQVVEVDHVGPVVTEPKVGSRRLVHLPQPAIDALREHLRTQGPALPTARLFTRRDGGELRAHHVHHAWQDARKKVGAEELHFHDLRHAGLTLSAQTGATLAEVMRRAGHVSSAAAIRYQHAADKRDAEIALRMSRYAAPPER
jgi:integrase